MGIFTEIGNSHQKYGKYNKNSCFGNNYNILVSFSMRSRALGRGWDRQTNRQTKVRLAAKKRRDSNRGKTPISTPTITVHYIPVTDLLCAPERVVAVLALMAAVRQLVHIEMCTISAHSNYILAHTQL